MPPPSYSSKISTGRSTGDHEPEIDANSKSGPSSSSDSGSEDESKKDSSRYDGVGIVKSLLGPSFEDAVLRTFEFGKSLIQKNEDNDLSSVKEKKLTQKSGKGKKELTPCSSQRFCSADERTSDLSPRSTTKKVNDGRFTRKRIVFTAKLDKEPPTPPYKPPFNYSQRFANVAKIRSLDSDLKQVAPSPEKIKRQLEALIQINKDEPPEHAGIRFYPTKTSKFHTEMTVMPSICLCKNDADVEPCSSGEGQSLKKNVELTSNASGKGRPNDKSNEKNNNDKCVEKGSERGSDRSSRRKSSGAQSGICQAPEFLTNALGPTLDVSIIDNLKMMRNLFKCENGKAGSATGSGGGGGGGGGGSVGGGGPAGGCGGGILGSNLAGSIGGTGGISLSIMGGRESGSVTRQSAVRLAEESSVAQLECQAEALKQKIEELQQQEQVLIKQIEDEEKERDCKRKAFEEEEKKLSNMKACLEGLVAEEKRKVCIQDSGDPETKYNVIRQKIACEEDKLARLKDQYECYRKEILEAKTRKDNLRKNKSLLDAWDVIASKACHTRLPSYSRVQDLDRKQLKSGDNVGNLHCCFMPQVIPTGNEGDCGRGKRGRIECPRELSTSCCPKEEPPFPIQRDVTCGLHKTLKPCCCSNNGTGESIMYTSDDDVLKLAGPIPTTGKSTCHSKSETLLKKDTCAKIVKVLWAITRINVFQDNCKTYEVMDASPNPPSCLPAKTEGIFVVKSSDKKGCHQKKRCG